LRSSGSADLLALDHDLPTTAADVAALRRARASRQVQLDDYIAFLQRLAAPSPARLRSRRGPVDAPFDLGR